MDAKLREIGCCAEIRVDAFELKVANRVHDVTVRAAIVDFIGRGHYSVWNRVTSGELSTPQSSLGERRLDKDVR